MNIYNRVLISKGENRQAAKEYLKAEYNLEVPEVPKEYLHRHL